MVSSTAVKGKTKKKNRRTKRAQPSSYVQLNTTYRDKKTGKKYTVT